MKLEFYYWSYMCPLHYDILQLLDLYCDRLDITIYDVRENPELAVEKKMFYPMLTIINGKTRYFSPLTTKFMDTLCKGIIPREVPYQPICSTNRILGDLCLLDKSKLKISCTCTGGCSEMAVQKKGQFLETLNQRDYGMMLLDKENNLLGGVEFVNSLEVPYAIPKNSNSAFLTCVYMSNENYDAKSLPLEELEKKLCDDYKDIYVISDEKGTFPNGDINFFLRHHYKDLGIVCEEDGYCRLHLMHKILLK